MQLDSLQKSFGFLLASNIIIVCPAVCFYVYYITLQMFTLEMSLECVYVRLCTVLYLVFITLLEVTCR